MRNYVWLCLVMLALGCGGGSDTSAPVAGVPLAINGPSRVDTSKPVAAPDLSDSVTNPVVEQLFQKARQAARDGHSASAIEAVSQAIGIDPGDSRLFSFAGRYLYAGGRIRQCSRGPGSCHSQRAPER